MSKVGIGGEKCVVDIEPGVYELRLSATASGFGLLCIPVYIIVRPSTVKDSSLFSFRVIAKYLKINIYTETCDLLNGFDYEMGLISSGPIAVKNISFMKGVLKGNGYKWPSKTDIMNYLIKQFNENK